MMEILITMSVCLSALWQGLYVEQQLRSFTDEKKLRKKEKAASDCRLSPRTYIYHELPLNWTAARDKCDEVGGTLTIVHDVSIMPDINASTRTVRNTPIWIGLYFENHAWQWLDGSIYDWSNWEPYFELRDGSCVTVMITREFSWQRTLCDQLRPFYCELKQGSCFYRVYRNSFIAGYDTFIKEKTTEDHCRDICEQATEITCHSYEYSHVLQRCSVSDINRWIEPNYFLENFNTDWDYFHKTCATAKHWPSISNTTENITISLPPTAETPTTVPGRIVSPPVARRYILYNRRLSWTKARDYCIQEGGNLATIYDEATIQETEYSRDFYKKTVWIGLSRKSETYWHWVDGTNLTWTNWMYLPSETDDSDTCSMLVLDESAHWYQSPCSIELWFLCQFPADSCTYTVVPNSGIIIHNKAVYHNVTVSECADSCNNMTDFRCMSFEYFPNLHTCQLCDRNRWTLPSYYKSDLSGLDYYHRHCNYGREIIKQTTSTTTPTTTAATTATTATTTATTTVLSTTTTVGTTTTTTATTTSTDAPTTEITTTKESTLESTTTETPTTERWTTTDPMKKFEVFRKELVDYGNKIREKRLNEKRTSAVDNRPSATGAGVVATVILASIIGFVLFLDIGTIKAHCSLHKNLRNRRRRRPRKPCNNLDGTNFTFKIDEVTPETADGEITPNSPSQSLGFEHSPDEYVDEIGLESNQIQVELKTLSISKDSNSSGVESVACQTDSITETMDRSVVYNNHGTLPTCVSVQTQTFPDNRDHIDGNPTVTYSPMIMDETKL